jgi:rhodanese-related sulfurtransferase/uncharacterized protein (DUF302 family)
MNYYFAKKLQNISFGKSVAQVTEALKKVGVGIHTEIDVKETFKKTLDEESYTILKVCNHSIVYKASQAGDKVDEMLPCNVVVQQTNTVGEVSKNVWKHLVLLMSILLITTSSCMAQKKVESGAYNLMLKTLLSHTVNEVSAQKADSMSNVVFIDSREKEEYEVSHIKDAVWVGYDDFDIKRMEDISKRKKIVVYCAVGARSEKISERLLEKGYSDVSNLYGGIFEWVNEGKPVYNNNGKTGKVHAYSKAWGVWLKEGEKVYGVNTND